MAGLGGQVEDRLRSQPAVEVVVQQDLGGAADLVAGRVGHGQHPRIPDRASCLGCRPCAPSPPSTRSPRRPARRSAPASGSTIDQDRINAFADATDDHQWIHVDLERAAAGPFGGTIAHGFLTLSLLPFFASQVFALETPGARLNYGLDKVRFPRPVPGRQPAALHVSPSAR